MVTIVDINAFFVVVVGSAVAAIETTVWNIVLFVNPTGLCAGARWSAVGVDHRVVRDWLAIAVAVKFAILIHEGLRVIGEVLEGWILGEITGPGIDGASAWVDGAGDDLTDGLRTNCAWGSHPKDGADIVIFLELIALEDVSAIDKDDDLIEMLFDHRDHILLILGELEGMSIGWFSGLSGVTGVHGNEVSAFGTGTDEDDKCGIAIFGKARFDSIGVTGDWGFADSEVVDTVITSGAFTSTAG